ncbi:MAG: GNAT family N-acetyltransferase [Syntrophales bacterium]|jgi:ribosomal protein S18 acetylase RimI-like enzyme
MLTVIRTSKKNSRQIYDLERRIFTVNECFSRSQLRYLVSSPNASLFLLRDNSSSVGFGVALRNKLRNGKYKGRIYSIGVLPGYRRMGAGKFLLEAMEKYLIKSKVSFIVLETLKGKGGAGHFFAKHGYLKSKSLRDYYPYGDAVRMKKSVVRG